MSITMCKTQSLRSMKSHAYAVQQYSLVWIDGTIDKTELDLQIQFKRLKAVINDINIFTQTDECIRFLNIINHRMIFLIVTGYVGEYIVPQVHSIKQLDTIYILCGNKIRHEKWAAKWNKIKGVFTDFKRLCKSLETDICPYDHDRLSLSLCSVSSMKIPTADYSAAIYFDRLQPSFMYTMLFKELILEIDQDDIKAVQNLVHHCQQQGISRCHLDHFQNEFSSKSAVWWYTCETFLYSMVNNALRILDTEGMMKVGFFIRKLHQQLKSLCKEQLNIFDEKFIVYRGQGFSPADFRCLQNTVDGFIGFNCFLSTSIKRDVAMRFMQKNLHRYTNNVGVLFTMIIDRNKVNVENTPFAKLNEYSRVELENEVLFSMNTVFRLVQIQQITNNEHHYEIQLEITDNSDSELIELIGRIKEEIDGTGWYRMGKLMLKIGDFHQAKLIYNHLLNDAETDMEKGVIFSQLGETEFYQGNYQEAINLYEKAFQSNQQTSNSDLLLASVYHNIADAHRALGEYEKALQYYEKSRNIKENNFPPYHPGLYISYNNIGGINIAMGNYAKALEYYEKALAIQQRETPSSIHPNLAISYNNIAGVYYHIGDHSKALEYYEKSHHIFERVLPASHLCLVTSYRNMSRMYSNMGAFLKAYEYNEKALRTQEESLTSNHPDLAIIYLSFAEYYEKIGDYTAALTSLQRAYEIQKTAFTEDQAEFAETYSWFGRVYRGMKDYEKALRYFEKCAAIDEETLPAGHPFHAVTYSNIGDIHRLTHAYDKALEFHRKALTIQENIQCNPLECATTFFNIGETYLDMKDYSMASTYFGKGLSIRQKILPKSHPDLADAFHKLAKLALASGNYHTGMKHVEQAIQIVESILPATQSHLIHYQETYKRIRTLNDSNE